MNRPALALLALLALACSPVAQPASSTGSLTGRPPRSSSASAAVTRWLAVRVDEPGGSLTAVQPSRDGFVAIGSVNEAARAWASPDGLAWTREPLPTERASPQVLVPWNDRLLVAGVGDIDRCGRQFSVAAAVRESGGWVEVPAGAPFCDISRVEGATDGDTAVLLGTTSRDAPKVVVSVSGMEWAEVTTSLPGPVVAAATARDGGGFLAAGLAPDGLWVGSSRDGASWVLAPPVPAPDGAWPVGIFDKDGATLLLVADETTGGTAYELRSGTSWQAAAARGAVTSNMTAVRQLGPGFVALGASAPGATIWTSRDLVTWSPAAGPASGRLEGEGEDAFVDVAVLGGRAVLVGSRVGGHGLSTPYAWVGPAELVQP